MSAWQDVYSDSQRAAVVHAGNVLKLRPWRRIPELAAAGELPDPDAPGTTLDAFTIPESSVRSIARTDERRREGRELPDELRRLPARDRAHALQLRLSGVIHHELHELEREQRRGRRPELQRVRDVGRALRELATLPDPHERRLPRAPGDREPGTGARPDGKTRHGLAGALMKAAARPVPDDPDRETHGEGHHDVYTPAENTNHEHDHAHEPDTHERDADCHESSARGSASAPAGLGAPAAA